jgi:hypothetical protein
MAAPALNPNVTAVTSDVVQTQSRRYDRDDRRNRFERRGNYGYYNGHRGFRERRRGYRQHNGFWFPPAAFIGGAILGGALSNQRAAAAGSNHVQWCANRWRSYRATDNTYQPSSGPRRACVSPYS